MMAVSALCAWSLFPFVMSTEVETSLDISELRNGQTIARDSSTSLGMTMIEARSATPPRPVALSQAYAAKP